MLVVVARIFLDSTEAAQYLMEGGENRSVGATAMNDVSSRSHAIFTVNFKIVASSGSTTKAKFHLVDLAGSERSKKTKATGTRFKEGVKINQGLLALGNVISALGGGSGATGGFISYRDSKLTRLLQDSLGGNSVTLMIACVSPADYNIEETLSTLRYADRAKKIKNKPIKNEDSHDGEVKRLHNMIHDLRIKLLEVMDPERGENEPRRLSVVHQCGEECKRLKAEKEIENRGLRHQLSCLMSSINAINSEHLMKETFYTELTERFEKLRDLLLNTCPAEFAMPETKIFADIEEQTKLVEALIQNYKFELRDANAEELFAAVNVEDSHFDDEASNQKMLEYTTTQMEAFKQIQTLEREMKIKQDLLERKFYTTPYLNEESEKTIGEYQCTIKTLEKELDELRTTATSSAARRDTNATKVNMDRKHRIEKLEKDLEETRKKCVTLEKTKKLAEQDRKRIEDLRREIQEMKTARVQLIRQQRNDSERYKKWIASRDKEINTLKEKGKKAQNEMKRMERMHEKQQAVLKRKVEEAKGVNKRLQDAMDRSKKAQSMRFSNKPSAEKTDVIQTYIDHELMVLMSNIDAKIAMQSLMNDRGLLTERLMNLKSTVNKNEAIDLEIKQLEEDLEMRNTQISDIRQKVMQTDLEAKVKSIPENFHSVTELKIAMGYVIRAVMDAREDFTTTKTKAEDLKIAYETSEERLEQLNEEMILEREEHKKMKSQLEHDFELKLSFMRQISENPTFGEGEKRVKENLRAPIFTSMTKQLTEAISAQNQLQAKVFNLEKQLEELREKSGKPRSKKSHQQHGNDTYTKEDDDIVSTESDEEFDFDDSFTDPEWRKTPAQKRSARASRTTTLLKESLTQRMNTSGILANISETSDTSSRKRSSQGQVKCNCKGSCATKQCGCKKFANFCSDTCRCSDACVNIPDTSKESDAAGGSDGKLKMEKENDANTERDESPVRRNTK